jgi:putative NIF3 family GTP cyclohydrolase 1 type 2
VRWLKAIELHAHVQGIGEWVDWDNTCDEFLAGDAGAEVKGIAVSWMPTFKNLESAMALGCNLFVTHEPLYVSDGDSSGLIGPEDAWVRKKEWLEETGMVVYRCHDFWDDYPEDGIHGAWARWLGFEGEPLARRKFYEVHAVEASSLGELAEGILERVRPLGQEVVHVIGDLEKNVSRIALGTGAITGYRQMYDMGADVLLLTDDGTRLWESGQWALDSGVPLMIVNHSTSEEPGMITLARYIRGTFPDVPVEHIPVGCLYETVYR